METKEMSYNELVINNFIISILVHKNVFCNKVSIADEKRVLVIV